MSHPFIDPEIIASVQSRIDALSPKARRKRLRQIQRPSARPEDDQVDVVWALEWIALGQGVSVARAAEMLIEKVADGSVRMTGVPVSGGAAIGPRERVPPKLFRGPPQ